MHTKRYGGSEISGHHQHQSSSSFVQMVISSNGRWTTHQVSVIDGYVRKYELCCCLAINYNFYSNCVKPFVEVGWWLLIRAWRATGKVYWDHWKGIFARTSPPHHFSSYHPTHALVRNGSPQSVDDVVQIAWHKSLFCIEWFKTVSCKMRFTWKDWHKRSTVQQYEADHALRIFFALKPFFTSFCTECKQFSSNALFAYRAMTFKSGGSQQIVLPLNGGTVPLILKTKIKNRQEVPQALPILHHQAT